MVAIRRLAPDDAALWRSLSLEAIANHPEAFVTRHDEESAVPLTHYVDAIMAGTRVFVAGNEDGIAFLRVSSATGSIHGLYVRSAARSAGLADALMHTLKTAAREAGCSRIELGVFRDNEAAVSLYRKHGFTRQSSEPFGTRESWTMIAQLD